MAEQLPIAGPASLRGAHIGISISDSPDLERLGLTEEHVRLAVADIARSVIVGGGRLVYGGDLRPDGYTTYLMDQLHRYSRRDEPLVLCLAWSIHRSMTLSAIQRTRDELGLFGRVEFLDMNGQSVAPNFDRGEEPPAPFDDDTQARSLSALRQFMTSMTQARVFIGGRREGFLGRMPGLLEEALLAVRAGQPTYLAGGFGGITFDILSELNGDHTQWLVDRSPITAQGAVDGLSELRQFRASAEWSGLNNGLTDDENRRLAATHRPSDIAALISIGVGRKLLEGH